MVIALIHWKIRPDRVVQDRRGLIGEFLSEACHTNEFPWITWDLVGREGVYCSFVNVGMWSDAEEFHDQIGKYFTRKAASKEFEYESRVRTILRPACWRIGDSHLPGHDSDGTL